MASASLERGQRIWVRGAAGALALLVALTTRVGADGSSAAAASPPPPPCAAWDIDYVLAANVQLSDTAFGAGDGVHAIGPGRMTLRVETPTDELSGHVKMLFYDMKDGFTVVAKALFWGTTVKNNTHTTAWPDASGAIAEGNLGARSLVWSSVVHAMRTDGTLWCEGSLCGKFGAPPDGASEVHTEPHAVTFNAFEFAADKKTFTMAYAVVSRSESPRQTSRITLAGREARRTCATPR